MILNRKMMTWAVLAAFLFGTIDMAAEIEAPLLKKQETSTSVENKKKPTEKKKSKKKKGEDQVAAPSKYKTMTGRDSLSLSGVMNVIQKGDTLYLELPADLLGKPFLVSNKLQQVPAELNEASANKGVNYANQMVRFEWDKQAKVVKMRQQRVTPEAPEGSYLARSVADNYIDPIIASLKVECVSPDSTSVIFKVNDLFNGKKNVLNDVFNDINLGTSPVAELSRVVSVKSYERSVVAKSELTTTVREGMSKVNVTVVVSTAICLLPEEPMARRREDWRVGYFSTPAMIYNDYQQRVENTSYITRWRLVPSDTVAYMRGELTEPVKPITFYIGGAVPEHLRPYIVQGILDWNKAFERAGFKNAVRAVIPDDTLDVEGDDMRYSVLTYAASEKANAMGPSTLDPRTGEILEADIIWWHNVQSLISEWIVVQTGAVDSRARSLELPIELIGDAVRFVACHEVGHSLGLRHNMMASAAYPTDSLRSETFTSRMGGTSASIMDYARFNYVAQPGDGVKIMSPHIGPYDLMAIEWGYRWYPEGTNEDEVLEAFLAKHQGKEYRYSETQQQRSAVDPRALSEDLGDDPIKSARLGIENLKRVMPHLIDWTRNNKPGQNYDEAAGLYSAVIYQWTLYLYHVMANIGGIYLDRPTIEWSNVPRRSAYTFVEKERQKEAVQFLLDEVLCFPEWLFGSTFSTQIYPLRKTPLGTTEQEPAMLLKNQQNYILWDLLANDRLVRMYQNEWMNGDEAFTAVELLQMLHQSIFRKTIAGQKLNVMERSLQKSFVDALITAAAENEGVKINKSIAEERLVAGSGSRTIDMTMTQITRTSDALSVKRAELLSIMKLMKSRANSGDLSTQMHYDDVVLRIQTALGLQK
ncbi:MAG: zinc-dependent metalloprotease [Bacteroidaceae bacterium]|nr:zinc-dependent metalloprotease [Bacteroidaceae bacterium]